MGGREGLFELAVMENGRVCYDTPITDDVIGYLTVADVISILDKIRDLKKTTRKGNKNEDTKHWIWR